MRQLLRCSSSIGANYIEANDALGRKDFLLKAKTSRREARETCYWLQLLELQQVQYSEDRRRLLIDEATQLIRILSAIIRKVDAINK
jgi:four helix bundle protein